VLGWISTRLIEHLTLDVVVLYAMLTIAPPDHSRQRAAADRRGHIHLLVAYTIMR
jgi:hypothetical protein